MKFLEKIANAAQHFKQVLDDVPEITEMVDTVEKFAEDNADVELTAENGLAILKPFLINELTIAKSLKLTGEKSDAFCDKAIAFLNTI